MRARLRSAPSVLGGLLLGGCSAGLACTPGGEAAPALPLQPCRLDGLGVEARCGRLPVFEDRKARQGRRIELELAVVPALAASARPDPLFILVGGPGQGALRAGPAIVEALRDVQRRRDIVLVDQRGTGGSHPLVCKNETESTLSKRFAPELDLEELRVCRDALDADTTLYTTDLAMDDLDEVRAALGYDRINLWGGSYGTRAALVYLRQHPDRVRSLVLDGSAPFDIGLPSFVARDGQRALDLLYADCAKDAECHATFPDGQAPLVALLSRLEQNAAEVRLPHPRTGRLESVRIDREGLAAALLNLLYVPGLAGLIPLGVERARAGDYSTLIASVSAFSDQVELAPGMFLSVVCAEDISRLSAQQAEERTRGTFLGGGWLARLTAQCAEWKSAELPASHFEPVRGAVPSLLLSGNLDPVTPPAWGELVSQTLTPSRHIVVPGAGHGVSGIGCVPELISDFVESLNLGALDVQCVERLERPAFFTGLEGPSP